MLKFEDPDAKYSFNDPKKKNSLAKTKVLTLLLVFVSLVFVLANNGYELGLLKTTIVPVATDCDPLHNFDFRDSEAVMVEKAAKVLEDNQDKFEGLEGFRKGYVKNVPAVRESKMIPQIILEFKEITEAQKSVPDKMCGFDVAVTYKPGQ